MLQRVQKIIANAGYCSRRKAEQLIEQSRVKVNEKTITIGTSADPDADKITIDNKPIQQNKKIYIMLNKPKKIVTTLYDPQGRRTVIDILNLPERVIPIGRLDYMTEGLLLLTNDGDFANYLMHPRYEIEKQYKVKLDKPLSISDEEKIKKGFAVDGKTTKPAKIKTLDSERTLVIVAIHEGRNRIIRNMMETLSYKIFRLERIKVGNVKLGDLPKGEWRELSPKEIDSLMKAGKR